MTTDRHRLQQLARSHGLTYQQLLNLYHRHEGLQAPRSGIPHWAATHLSAEKAAGPPAMQLARVQQRATLTAASSYAALASVMRAQVAEPACFQVMSVPLQTTVAELVRRQLLADAEHFGISGTQRLGLGSYVSAAVVTVPPTAPPAAVPDEWQELGAVLPLHCRIHADARAALVDLRQQSPDRAHWAWRVGAMLSAFLGMLNAERAAPGGALC